MTATAAISSDHRLRAGAVVLFGLFVLMQLVQVRPESNLDNGDFYLRDASAFASGHVPRSRYSPGFSLVLVPLVKATGQDFGRMTVAAEVLGAVVALAAAYLLLRLLRLFFAPWLALSVLGAFVLGQASTIFFAGVVVEPLAMLLLIATLLALARQRTGAAIALTAAAVLVRVALVPFFAALWLFQVRRMPKATAGALALIAVGVLAHLAKGSVIDQSYADIGRSASGIGAGGPASSVVSSLARGAFDRLEQYGRFAGPRLLWPFRAIDSPLGIVLVLVTAAVVVLGVVALLRAGRTGGGAGGGAGASGTISGASAAVPGASGTIPGAVAGFVAYAGALLVWPVTPTIAVRMLIPVAPVIVLGLGAGIDAVRRRSVRGRAFATGLLAMMMVSAVVASASAVYARRSLPPRTRQYIVTHERARALLPAGAILSRKAAFTELATGHRAYAFAGGSRERSLDRLAERVRACSFVLDHPDPALLDWLARHSSRTLASEGRISIVSIAAPWCG